MKNFVYTRNDYFATVAPFLGTPVIKVLTGMRRSGKSFLLRQILAQLRADGVPARNIVYVDKEDYAFDAIRDYHALAAHVDKALKGKRGRTVVCVDEVQEIEGWERIVASWSGKANREVFITGSNASLLSSELATLLAGRYIEFPVRPLSFAEFLQFREKPVAPDADEFQNYLRYGGLPGLHTLGTLSDETFRPYTQSIFDTIMLKDVVSRHQVRNMALLERVARYVMDNTGNLLNASRIAAFMKNQRVSASVDTILTQLHWFNDAHLTERALLYDLKGKRHLEINEKHYLTDFGLKHAVLGWRAADIGGLLENIVFLELRRRGYTVSVGRFGDMEIDFVAERNGERAYYQVAYLLSSKETLEREVRSLLAVGDNYPKYLLSMDNLPADNPHGVARRYLPDWLLGAR
ncbi:MAG: ATP-binding protein [Puniceicoccales bacterium]|nr:ATP-binding protein [Puniceicoccales bacterium]